MLERLKSVMKDTVRDFRDAEITLSASSLAYTTILSIIPLIAVSFSIFKAFGGMERLYDTIEPFIFENLAEGADEKTLGFLRTFVSNIHAGTLGAGGFIGLLITTMSMLNSVEKTFSRIWKSPVTRSVFQRIATYWFFITLGPIALSLTIGFATSSNLPLASVLPGGFGLFLILLGIFFGMYKWIPSRSVHWRPALTAAFVTSFSWIIAKGLYSLYVRKVVSYDKIYGSLGAIPIFLIWIYVAWIVVLGGASLSHSLQRRFEQK